MDGWTGRQTRVKQYTPLQGYKKWGQTNDVFLHIADALQQSFVPIA